MCPQVSKCGRIRKSCFLIGGEHGGRLGREFRVIGLQLRCSIFECAKEARNGIEHVRVVRGKPRRNQCCEGLVMHTIAKSRSCKAEVGSLRALNNEGSEWRNSYQNNRDVSMEIWNFALCQTNTLRGDDNIWQRGGTDQQAYCQSRFYTQC